MALPLLFIEKTVRITRSNKVCATFYHFCNIWNFKGHITRSTCTHITPFVTKVPKLAVSKSILVTRSSIISLQTCAI